MPAFGVRLCAAPLDTLKESATKQLSRQQTHFLFGAAAATTAPIIAWHRVAAFQLMALAQIAERVLLASPAYASNEALPLYVHGAIAWAHPRLRNSLELRVSPSNPPAAVVAKELAHCLPGLIVVEASTLGDHSDGMAPSLSSSSLRSSPQLVHLSPDCFEGAMGERLAGELTELLQHTGGESLVLVHSPDEMAGEFGDIIAAVRASASLALALAALLPCRPCLPRLLRKPHHSYAHVRPLSAVRLIWGIDSLVVADSALARERWAVRHDRHRMAPRSSSCCERAASSQRTRSADGPQLDGVRARRGSQDAAKHELQASAGARRPTQA